MGIRSPSLVKRPVLSGPAVTDAPLGLNNLEIHDLSLTIKGKCIYEPIDFALSSGQILALTGENGAGKTSLARTISGLQKASSGTVSVNGKIIKEGQRRKHIWYSSNDVSAQFFTASVADEVLLLADRSEENLERARIVLETLGLYELKDNHPASLSGGQKQRLSIACGLVCGRSVLILDEPTSGLDSINMNNLAKALRFAADEGVIVMVITHDNEFMAACCTHELRLPSPRN